MTTGNGSMVGYAPSVVIRPVEREIYRQLWERPEYRAVAPGEHIAHEFLKQAKPKHGASVIDFGCGTGRGALALAFFGGLDVTMVDFANNCLDDDIRQMLTTQAQSLRFVEADLYKGIPVSAPYGFCTDVMEHIPPQCVDRVLDNVLKSAQHVFFQISTIDDVCGALVGHKLHLSVNPYAWWLQKFNERDCVVHWSKDCGDSCLFYVSGWIEGNTLVEAGQLNVSTDEVRANVRANVSAGWAQVTPHETNDAEVMIIGGGPSLRHFEDEIKLKRENGVKLITLNGTYGWCLERGLTPSAQIMVDARPFNKRFIDRVVDGCKYLISSQCHPSVLEGLPKYRTLLWHTATDGIADILKEHYETWWSVPGGSTVLLRAIPLLRMLGFKRFHLYGCDSCLDVKHNDHGSVVASAHHAYSQPENDSPAVIAVSVLNGRVFYCHPWMAAQATEMMHLIKFLGDEIELEIYGDGLLSHILHTGAEFAAEHDFLQ